MAKWLLVLGMACATPAPSTGLANVATPRPTVPATRSVTLPTFGEIRIEDGAMQIMDHNNGDARVHVMTISRELHGSKVSWDDLPGLRSDERSDTFPIGEDERAYIRSWSEPLWQLAPSGRRSFGTLSPGTKSYEWAVVMRRGDEVRVIEGGAASATSAQPDFLNEVVDFLDMHF